MSIFRQPHNTASRSLLQASATAILGALGASLFFAQPAIAQSAIEDVIIHEVFYSGGPNEDWVELKNVGSETQDISAWWLCSRYGYEQITDLTILAGPSDGTLQPGELIVVQLDSFAVLDDLEDTAADVGLYSDSFFGNPDFMADFLQYGTMNEIGRSVEASDKGIWLRLQAGPPPLFDTALPVRTPSETLSYCGDAGGSLLSLGSDYQSTPPTLGTENTTCATPVFSDGFESGDTSGWSDTAQ